MHIHPVTCSRLCTSLQGMRSLDDFADTLFTVVTGEWWSLAPSHRGSDAAAWPSGRQSALADRADGSGEKTLGMCKYGPCL